MLKDIIVLGIVIFLIYRILNRYVLPIFRFTTVANDSMRKMKEQMKEMEQKMHQPANPNNYQSSQKKTVEKEGDYIDYEEVR